MRIFLILVACSCLLFSSAIGQGTIPRHIWSFSASRLMAGNVSVNVTSRLGTYHWLWFGGIQYQMPAQVTPIHVRRPSPMREIAGLLNYRTSELLPSTWTNSAGVTLGLQNILFGTSASGFIHGPWLALDLNRGRANYWQRDADLNVHVTGQDKNSSLTLMYEVGFRLFRAGESFVRISAAGGISRIREIEDHTHDAYYASTGAYRSQNRILRDDTFFQPSIQLGLSLNLCTY